MNEVNKADYHIHYYIDKCADSSMTLPNIISKALSVGMKEICIVKHYSAEMPDGSKAWHHWAKTEPAEFKKFIAETEKCDIKNLRLLRGAETEIIDESGNINIPLSESVFLDMVNLSCHWLPRIDGFEIPYNIYPGSPDIDFIGSVMKYGFERFIGNVVNAYVNAIIRNPSVRNLSHMYDGFQIFREYGLPISKIKEEKLIEIMKPLYEICVSRDVLWELLPNPYTITGILYAAAGKGVLFTPTTDAHFISGGWADMDAYSKSESYIRDLGLPVGNVVLYNKI